MTRPPRPPDAIVMTGLTFYGYHGALPEERTLGQRFVVDVRLELDLAPAGRADDLALTVDYGRAWGVVREAVAGPPLDLIEALAERVAAGLLGQFGAVERAFVRVRKPAAPVRGAESGAVCVEIWRDRAADGMADDA